MDARDTLALLTASNPRNKKKQEKKCIMIIFQLRLTLTQSAFPEHTIASTGTNKNEDKDDASRKKILISRCWRAMIYLPDTRDSRFEHFIKRKIEQTSGRAIFAQTNSTNIISIRLLLAWNGF